MKRITLKKLLGGKVRNNLLGLAFLLFGGIGTASAQVSAYSRTQLSGLTYTQIAGGTVINTDSQLSPGMSNNQNDGGVLVTLPFTFTYEGIAYTQVTFCTNGWIAMGNQMSMTNIQSRTSTNLFSNTIPNSTLAPWFGELSGNWPGPLGNGSMVHGSTGTGVYAFEWRNANGGGNGVTTVNNINFKVLLYGPASTNPGRIEFLYGSQTGTVTTGAFRSIGIEDATGGVGHFINALDGLTTSTAYPEAWPGDGNGYRFDPPVACNGVPSAGTPAIVESVICNNVVPPSISMSGVTVGTGVIYQWEESTNGGSSWANAIGGTGATTIAYTPPAFAGTTIKYRLRTTCTNSSQTVLSNPTTFIPSSAPSTQVTGLTGFNSTTAATFNWTNGNGNMRLVAISNVPIVDPVNGVQIPTYTTNTTWQNAGQQYLYNGANASTTITGLTCGTTYYVKVYEYNRCGAGAGPFDTYINVTSGTNTMTFTATPAMAGALPLTEDFSGFDGNNAGYGMPGWYESAGTTGASEPSVSNPTGITSNWNASTVLGVPTIKSVLFNNTQNNWFISPKITLTVASRIKFKAAITDNGNANADPNRMQGTDDKVRVMISTDGCGATWTPAFIFEASNTTDLTNVLTDYVIGLGSYTGQTIQIAFQVTSGPVNNSGVNYEFHIANFLLEELPPCAAPIVNDVTNITKESATISWQFPAAGVPTAYEYAVVETNAAPASGTETTETSVNLTSAILSPSTTYYVFVRTECTDVLSDWSIVKIFTTLCDYPDLLTSEGDTACGLGEATLTATAEIGGIISWYAAAQGGTPLGFGTSYVASGLEGDTDFYVSTGMPIASQDISLGSATGFSLAIGVSPYFNNAGGVKTQYIIRASELQAAGLYAGPINSLAISVNNPGENVYNGFAVSIGQTTQNEATATHVAGLTQVYSNAVQVLTSGFNTYAFTTPFNWDGTSNLVVQVCFSNNNSGNGDPTTWSNVSVYPTGFTSNTYTQANFVTPDDICGATGQGGGVGTSGTASSRPVMLFNGTTLCSSPRVAVTVTVNDAPDIVPSVTESTICAGESTELSVASDNTGYSYSWMPGNLTGAVQTVSPIETTTYTVTATDISGCVEVAELTVTVNVLPAAIVITAPTSDVCQNSIVMLTASESGPDYTWSPVEGLFTDEAATLAYTGDSVATVYYFADEDATFTVTATNENGCSITADINITVTIIAAPEANVVQTICNAGTVADLEANGDNILWYSSADVETPLAETDALTDGAIYYASQTIDGCESLERTEVTVEINVVPAPEGDEEQMIEIVSPEDATIEDIQVDTLEGGTVTWYPTEEDAIAGTNAIEAGTQLESETTYYATQTVSSCTSADVFAVTVTLTLDNKEFNSAAFTYYPNPVKDVLTLSYSQDISNVTVYNMIGQLVMTQQINAVEDRINMSNLADGTYMLNVTFGNTVKTIRVIKKQ